MFSYDDLDRRQSGCSLADALIHEVWEAPNQAEVISSNIDSIFLIEIHKPQLPTSTFASSLDLNL